MAAPPFKVKSIFEYTSEHDDDLNFPVGQVITVTELEGDDWCVGEYTDASGAKQSGLFPSNFVEKYEPEVPVRPTRPSRPKQEIQSPPPPAPALATGDEEDEEEAPPVPATSKPKGPPVEMPTSAGREEEVRSPPPAPKPAPAELAEPVATPAKKAPPPVAAKSNAFKDRIAAFNQTAAAPIAPMQPGRQNQPSGFIKKPFVAPPPSKNAYVPPPTKVEPVHRPYVREEDPEIKEREEEDRAAAAAAGLTGGSAHATQAEEDEDAPKPLTLKERMALLQKQQQEQAQRRAEVTQKKDKRPPAAKPSELSEGEEEEPEHVQPERSERQSLDASREKPRVPAVQHRSAEPMPPVPAVPEHEMADDRHEADQSGAGDMTEDDVGASGPGNSDDPPIAAQRHPAAPGAEADVGDEDDTTERDDDEEEEDSMDEETRRKEALRARMARLGGGPMGMQFNPFGAPPPAPPARKKSSKDRKASEDAGPATHADVQQRVPVMPVPGMQRMQSPDSDVTEKLDTRDAEEDAEGESEEEMEVPPPPKRSSTMERSAAPPVPKDSRPVPQPPPQERGAVPPVPGGGVPARPTAPESRPVPPPPPSAAPMSPGPGSESDDEMSTHARSSYAETSGAETPLPTRGGPPPVPGPRELPPVPGQSSDSSRASYFGGSEPTSTMSDKRLSRPPPPVPGSPLSSPRPPPPPPPAQAPPSREATMGGVPHLADDDENIGSEYDGDYDTDIASSAPRKDALKAPHNREASLTDSPGLTDDTLNAPAPRAVPPPPPPHGVPKTRPSMDRPPPPVPPGRDAQHDEEYDPYNYSDRAAVPRGPADAPMAAPPVPPVQEPEQIQGESSADELYDNATPPRKSTDRAPPLPPQDRAAPPLPPQDRAVPPPPQQTHTPTRAPPKESLDLPRTSTMGRRSMEQGRPSGEHGQMATDVDLSTSTPWWTAAQPLPPVFQSRNGVDLLSEREETSKSKRGGKKEITKDIYVLFMDYSQTVISVRFDSQEPMDAHVEQRHEPPPPKLRQDQLEAAWQRFGAKIADAANALGNSKKDTTVGDGSPYSLPLELVRAQLQALQPVGTRAYGALVYANLANASTMQFDEIRRGDILTARNAKFEGHHGAMKTKYRADYGPGHVAVVEEWDGTRRAVRAWEQGRDKKGGVRSEKFRLGDLRSGEVRVWRVVGRDWVGWDS